MSAARMLSFFGRRTVEETPVTSSSEKDMSQLLSNIENILHNQSALGFAQFSVHMQDLQQLAQGGNELAAKEYVKLYRQINEDALNRIFPEGVADEQLVEMTIRPAQFENYMRSSFETPQYSM